MVRSVCIYIHITHSFEIHSLWAFLCTTTVNYMYSYIYNRQNNPHTVINCLVNCLLHTYILNVYTIFIYVQRLHTKSRVLTRVICALFKFFHIFPHFLRLSLLHTTHAKFISNSPYIWLHYIHNIVCILCKLYMQYAYIYA